MFISYANFFLTISVSNFAYSLVPPISSPIASTKDGLIAGTYTKTFNGRILNAFLGVPFGKPPIGDLRFSPPLPAEPWSGIYYANQTKSACLQFNHLLLAKKLNPIVGDEDCLYLNIYTPYILDMLNRELMDVVVFIHGGSFMFGKSSGFHPKYLLDENNFVFITIAYRLGPLGFLSTEDEIVPGNNGLKDQVMALKWINKNIRFFGGNPAKVTITGFSAGGASVHLHYLSPLSKHLFQKGISISGTSLCPWAYMKKPKQKTIQLASSLNCPINNTKILINCLRNIKGELILSKIKPLFLGWLYNPIAPFGPTAEVNNTHQFLSAHPSELLKRGEINDLPWLNGFATEEGLYPASEFILNKILMNELNKNLLKILPYILDYDLVINNEQEKMLITDKISKFYLKGNSTVLTKKGRNALIKMISDRMYINAIDRAVKLQTIKTKSPIYLYNFAYRGKYSMSDMFTGVQKNVGVSHGDDLAYVLESFFSSTDNKNDTLMVNFMVNLWSSFIKNNAPIIVNKDLIWEPIKKISNNSIAVDFLFIKSNDNIKMVSDNNLGNNLFWNSLNHSEFIMN